MNKREASIISAYTGYLIGEFSDLHEYVEEIIGRSVLTHELANEKMQRLIREKSKIDFMNIEVKDND